MGEKLIELNPTMPGLVLVAHWDDETFTAGGLLIRYGELLTVISATSRSQMIKYCKVFHTICTSVGARAFTLPIEQRMERYNSGKESVVEFRTRVGPRPLTVDLLKPRLRGVTGLDEVYTVFTHGLDGDLGHHTQHKELARIVAVVFQDKKLFYFTWDQSKATHKLSLNESEFVKKLDMVKKYDSRFLKHKFRPVEYYMEGK